MSKISDNEISRTGFIGLGRMGRAMALNMAAKSHELAVFDIDPEAMEGFDQSNQCRQALDACDAATGADLVITVLPGPPQLESVVLAENGVLDNMEAGSILMDFSTVLPATTDRMAAEAKKRSIHFVDAPIGRLASHADTGESLFMVGSEDAIFQRILPVLQTMGTTIQHCGGPGSGTRTKLINNYLAITSCQMNAECMALTQSFGLDLETTLSVIHGTSATNGQLKLNYENKVLLNDIEPGFAIDLAHKDLSLIMASANDGKVSMPLAAAARESLSLARSAGWGGKDFSGLADFWCETAGLDKPRLK